MTPTGTGGPVPTDGVEEAPAAERRSSVVRVVVFRTLLVTAVLFVLIQFVPYGWGHDNPPVVSEAPWPDAASERIARTSCYSCHSNETDWPIYSYVAPMSWLVRADVDQGRDEFNFSDWDPGDADDAIEMIEEGRMPPDRYVLIHRDARLSSAERDTLIAALLTMSGDRNDRDDRDDERGLRTREPVAGQDTSFQLLHGVPGAIRIVHHCARYVRPLYDTVSPPK